MVNGMCVEHSFLFISDLIPYFARKVSFAMDSSMAIQEHSWSGATRTGDNVQSHMHRLSNLLGTIGLCTACA